MDAPDVAMPHNTTTRNTPRRRIEKACEPCRRRKARCNGTTPICSACRISGRDCSYDASSNRRGLPEGWVKTLEKLWALACLAIPELDSVVLSLVKDGLALQCRQSFCNIWAGNAPECLLNRWKSSVFANEIQYLLPQLESLSPPSPNSGATTTLYNPSVAYSLVHSDLASVTAWDNVRRDLSVSEQSPRSYPPSGSGLSLPENYAVLIESYLSTTQGWFPILDRADIRRTCYWWSNKTSTLSKADRSCLYAVFACAAIEGRPRHSDSELEESAEFFAQKAQALIGEANNKLEIAHVQALLVLTLYHVESARAPAAWLTVGQALRAALLLHHNTTPSMSYVSSSNTDPTPVKRALLGCLVLESILSAHLAMPASMRIGANGIPKVTEDVLEEWEPNAVIKSLKTSEIPPPPPSFCISTFNHLAEVSDILHNITILRLDPAVNQEMLITLRHRLATSDCAYLRLGSWEELARTVQLSPQQYSLRLAQLVALCLTLSATELLQDEASDMAGEIGSLALDYSAHLPISTVPTIWQPLLSLAVGSMTCMASNEITRTATDKIASFVAAAATSSPCFRELEARCTQLAQIQVSTAAATNPVFMCEEVTQANDTAADAVVPMALGSDHGNDLTTRNAMDETSLRTRTGLTDDGLDLRLQDLVELDALTW